MKSSNMIILFKDNKGIGLQGVKKYLEDINKDNKCFYRDLKYSNYYESYYPFFSFIKEDMGTKQVKTSQYFNDKDIYPIHKQLFESYIAYNMAERNEDIIPFDYEYERKKLYDSFLNIFCRFGDKENIYILLENINYMCSSTLNWMIWFVESHKECRVKFILTLTSYEYHIKELEESFENLIEKLESEYLLLQTEVGNYIRLEETNEDKWSCTPDNILNIGENLFQFFSFKEALECYKKYYKNIEKKKLNEEYEYVTGCIGDIYLLIGKYHKSYSYYDALLNKAIESSNLSSIAKAFLKLSMLDVLSMKFNQAEKLVKKAYKIANSIDDDYLKLSAYKIFFWINEKGGGNKITENLKEKNEIIMLSRKYKQKNFLAYFLTHSFNSAQDEESKRRSLYEKGFRIAEGLKNDNCILSAYLKTALDYGSRGTYNKSIVYYKKVENILKENNDDFRLAQTYNGIGYYCMIYGKFQNAEKYYNRAINLLKRNWNFDEICMTLLNKSINAMLVWDYTTAERELEILCSVVNELKIYKLRLTTLSQLYGILALNHGFLGNSYRSYAFLGKMQERISINHYSEDEEEQFLYNFTEGILLKKKNCVQEAEKCFQEAFYFIGRINGSLKCFYPQFVSAYEEILTSLNKYDELEVLQKAEYEYSKKYNHSSYMNIMDGDGNTKYDFSSYLNHLTWIVEAAKQQQAIICLNRKIDEINFINSFEEILTNMDEKCEVIKNAMILIENRFSIDYSLLVAYDEEKSTVLYSTNDREVSNMKLYQFNILIKKYSRAFVTRNNSEFHNYISSLINCEADSVLYIPIFKDGALKCVFLCVTKADEDESNSKVILDVSNLKTINIVIHQLSEVIQRIQWQNKLITTASTDMLTGLYNRQYFYSKLNDIISRSLYSNIGNMMYNISLFYIDLDNFKYYNDTFGHSIGDSVLIWFSGILKEVCEENSYAIRFGGDEFILLVEKCDKKRAIEISESIYDKLKELEGFKGRIAKILNKNICIPDKYILTCSMGIISAMIDKKIDINDFIDKADKCLYEAKNTGKGRFIMYMDKS